jgi:hypothetical protein
MGNKIDNIYDETNPFHISTPDKVVGLASLLGLPAVMISTVISKRGAPEAFFSLIFFSLFYRGFASQRSLGVGKT